MALTDTPTDLGSLPTSQAMRIPQSWYVDPAQFERNASSSLDAHGSG